MNERSDNKSGLVLVILMAIVIGGGWFFFQRSGVGDVSAAIDETVEVFVPNGQEFERRTSPIGEARRVTNLINARQTQSPE